MPDEAKRGDHAWVDTNSNDQFHDKAYLAKSVFDAEIEAIDKRRQRIKKDKGKRDRTACPRTGLAFSGGGIRSASFGLGALQALHAYSGIEGIDYLSTVSGGGYIGCSLTAAMQKTDGEFPFTNPKNYDDTDSVRHIRDYSNYLIPHGALDVVTALAIIGRGLVANALIVVPILLFFVWLTLLSHPTEGSLDQPIFLGWKLAGGLAWFGLSESPTLWGLHSFWFTAFLLVVDLLFLIVWGVVTSMDLGSSAKLRGVWVGLSKVLFVVTLTTALFEAQPVALRQFVGLRELSIVTSHACSESFWSVILSSECLMKHLDAALSFVTANVTQIGSVLGAIGGLLALFAKYFGDVVAAAKRQSGWRARIKKILAKAALWFAAIIVPFCLWLLYLNLTYIGLSNNDLYPFAPDSLRALAVWAPQSVDQLQGFVLVRWTGETSAARLYFEGFVVSLLLARLINPNVTSLHRLYRDRLSKAFLFDPNPGENQVNRDKYGDLQAYDELKLHEIDTDLCPYPIINASLNIEGSQYANKRGRNADFFIFAPEYTGSGATGYVGTQRIEKDAKALDLGTAMAISGAAVSSEMGAKTIKPLAFTLALLNFRLGYWLRNPASPALDSGKSVGDTAPRAEPASILDRFVERLAKFLFGIGSFRLLAEMFGLLNERSSKVYLTDGGHIENLGVYSLLKRRCKVIIAIDAVADPTMSFGNLLTLERYARLDLGATIELPWQAIRAKTLEFNKAFDNADEDGSAIPCSPGQHCAAGEIQYGPNDTGILLYVKASLSGDEADYILDYKRRNRAFPHETTGDQFFNEAQLEAYRALGFHIMKGLLTREIPFAVPPGPSETEGKARLRILSTVRAALLGTAAGP